MHAPAPKSPAARLVVTRLTMDLLRSWSKFIRKDGKFGSDLETAIIMMAVAIGHLEERPMSASKISNYIGMPRTTVLRRLHSLQKCGVITRLDGGSFAFALSAHEVNSPARLSFVRHAAGLIHRASRDLSKLDSE